MRDEYLFVYGTLRRDAAGKTHPLLAGCTHFLAEARYHGRLYRIADYPGVVPSDSPRDHVLGEVYTLEAPRMLLSRLDAYEGCGPRFPPPTEYVRRIQEVRLGDGTVLRAWIYLYNRSTSGLHRIKSGDFLRQS